MQNIAAIYAKNFDRIGFSMLQYEVVVSVLYFLYPIFVKDGIDPIEAISQEKKLKYFSLSGIYFSETQKRVKASKAAYVLELITSTF